MTCKLHIIIPLDKPLNLRRSEEQTVAEIQQLGVFEEFISQVVQAKAEGTDSDGTNMALQFGMPSVEDALAATNRILEWYPRMGWSIDNGRI